MNMDNQACYLKVPESGIYIRNGYAGIPYSDGGELEARLLRDVRACADVSDSSTALRQCISDWPSEYHFSPQRANLLRPFSFKGLEVLELGCGCGAITRFLGEHGATVIAVEGSPTRAAIAAARCRDLPNVNVYCDNIASFQTDKRFDVVTLIGVLEYSRIFLSAADDAVQRCLEIARGFLSEDGELYLAIENQLGLKYFNGCAEDHTGIPFFGINDRYSSNTAVTFGKKELTERIRSSGFTHLEFFYPFPDYKLPELLVTESGMQDERLRPDDLLCRIGSRDYGGTGLRSFNEGAAWRVLARNALAGELANSFLVKASVRKAQSSVNWKTQTFNNLRLPEYATQTKIFEQHGALHVCKEKLFPAISHSSSFQHIVGAQNYIYGNLHIAELKAIMESDGDIGRVAAWAGQWLDYLRSRIDEDGFLPEDHVDCIPTNLIRDASGQFNYIDIEWRANEKIPFHWVAARGVVLSLSVARMLYTSMPKTYRQLANEILVQAGFEMNDQDWRTVVEWENALYVCAYGGFRSPLDFAEFLDMPCVAHPTATHRLREMEAEINHLKQSFSWRMTKSLRILFSKMKRFTGITQ